MDFFATLFSLAMFISSIILAYRWGIKPDREAKKRRAEQAVEEMRRRHWERSRRRRAA